MCGIFGVVGVADRALGERVAASMRHRGPDDHGVWVSEGGRPVTLVNTRLAIIDLSPLGHMPMTTVRGDVWIAYNGEVFNFAETRAELEKLGHAFRSNSDTEVIANAYEQWSDECVHHFRGMFAILIWDLPRQRLFAARDRLGIKPIYWAETIQGLVLGSELKALIASGLIQPAINLQAIYQYLSFYSVPCPLTMLEGVHALPPGYCLVWENGKTTTRQYWEVPSAQPLRADENEIRAELRRLLKESIRLRMIADVSVGAFLSGGVDSSAVVGLMTRVSGERLKTFSIGFDASGASIDERSYARMVARKYDTDHTEVIVSGEQVAGELDKIIWSLDQPSGDGLNTYLVSQATARHVKVALSGLGGDELFAGYPQFRLLQQAEAFDQAWRILPGAVRRSLASSAGALSRRVGGALAFANDDFVGRYARVRVLFPDPFKVQLLTPPVLAGSGEDAASRAAIQRYLCGDETNVIDRVTRLELKNYMAHILLRDTDAMSMAHSLEVRVPLIDHKLVEFVTTIPAHLRLRNGQSKYLLTAALADILPHKVVARRKQGFEMPVASWMRTALRPALDDVFSTRSLEKRGWLQPGTAQAVYREFLDGRGAYMRVWSLAVLELWARQYVG